MHAAVSASDHIFGFDVAAQSDLRSLGSCLIPMLLLFVPPGELEGPVEESPSSSNENINNTVEHTFDRNRERCMHGLRDFEMYI